MVHDDAVRRLRRPTWRDPRLGVGVLLVAASVALGTWAVRDAADTVEVYATREAVTPGQSLDASALVVQEVRLGAQESLYLRADADLPEGAVAVRTVGAGELVPRSALGLSDDVDARPVVVPLDASVPADLAAGSVVDLWLAPPPPVSGLGEDGPAEPSLLAADLVVSDVVEDESMFTGGTGVSVELLVPRLDLPQVLAALPGDGHLVVVPTFGGDLPDVAAPTDAATGPAGTDGDA